MGLNWHSFGDHGHMHPKPSLVSPLQALAILREQCRWDSKCLGNGTCEKHVYLDL